MTVQGVKKENIGSNNFSNLFSRIYSYQTSRITWWNTKFKVAKIKLLVETSVDQIQEKVVLDILQPKSHDDVLNFKM